MPPRRKPPVGIPTLTESKPSPVVDDLPWGPYAGEVVLTVTDAAPSTYSGIPIVTDARMPEDVAVLAAVDTAEAPYVEAPSGALSPPDDIGVTVDPSDEWRAGYMQGREDARASFAERTETQRITALVGIAEAQALDILKAERLLFERNARIVDLEAAAKSTPATLYAGYRALVDGKVKVAVWTGDLLVCPVSQRILGQVAPGVAAPGAAVASYCPTVISGSAQCAGKPATKGEARAWVEAMCGRVIV